MHADHPRGQPGEPVSVPLCYYGSPEPLPPRRALRAGPLACVYEAGDLRYVTVNGVEVCRRLYAAVRDENWGTVPGVLSDERVYQGDHNFLVSYTCTHRQGGVHFVWKAWISGTPGGLTFTFDGEARSDFRRNRIGLCVLHPPASCAGQAVELVHPDDTREATAFPDLIAPANPFRELAILRHALQGGGRAEWCFHGDVFETEDQRNWTDASFKTFCTPLSRPFPVAVKAGDRVRQTVTLGVDASGPAEAGAAAGRLTLSRRDGPPTRLPDLGLGPVVDRRGLGATFVRADLDLTRPGWADELRAVADPGGPLELAVTVSAAAWDETAALIPVLLETNPTVERVLVVRAGEWATRAEDVPPVVEAFARAGLQPQVFGGTTANFAEFNRRRPPLEAVQGVCYSAQPQEHAFDNASLVECCAALADTVRTARAIAGDRPLSVGPITLRKRVNPYATGPGWRPPPPDPRHRSLFGAGWTLAALKYLAERGAEAVSFDEPPGLPGWPVWLQPLYDLSGWEGAAVLPTASGDPLAVSGLMVRRWDYTRLLLANHTAEPVTLTVSDLPASVKVYPLDETNYAAATADRRAFTDRPARSEPTAGGRLTLTLRPYAYVRLDGR